MKKITLITGLLLAFFCMVQAKERVVEQPPFLAWSSTSIEIDKIVMSDTSTVVHIKAFYYPKNWIKIATGSFLRDNNGAIYPILKGVGITLDKELWMPDSGEAEFQLFFPPIPTGATSLDFSEGDFDGSFKIWGIQLDEKNYRKKALPKDLTSPKINMKATLPLPEFAFAKAKVKGKIIGFQKDMPLIGQLHLNDPIRWSNFSQEIVINENGTFEVQVDVATTTPATLSFPFAQIPCLFAPGKESTITINLVECSRQQSRLLKDSKPYGKKAYYAGYLAELQQELIDNSIKYNMVYDMTQLLKEMEGKNIDEAKTYFLEQRKATFKQIESAHLSPAAKDVLKANTNITTSIGLFMAKDLIIRAYTQSQNMNREQTIKYYKNNQIALPADYYYVLKDFSLNHPSNLYATEFAYGTAILTSRKEEIKKIVETDRGLLFELATGLQYYQSIDNYTPLTDEQKTNLSMLNPAYKELLLSLNNDLILRIEANKQKSGFTIHEVPDVSNEDLFTSIISKFKGRVLLVDFWATWCGPCRVANKEMAPMKEDLKDKDIVYLYITGETSPKGTWENMISDIHGEHFRVSNEQWNYLMSKYEVEGVPTYYIIDREGNITYKQTGYPGINLMKEQLTKALNK